MIRKEIAPHVMAAIEFATNTGDDVTLRTLQIQEDCILKAIWKDGVWEVSIDDVFSKKSGVVQWTPQEFAAVQFIVYNGDERTGPISQWNQILMDLYSVAEQAIAKFPDDVRRELRPIP